MYISVLNFLQAGHSKIAPVPGKDQTLVTGNGGPSGTGKRPAGEPVLPPPVFIQDNNNMTGSASSGVTASGATGGASSAAPAPGIATPAAIGSGIGVSIVAGRPAPVSRSGTATWGAPATLAAIVSGTADGASPSPFAGPPLPSPSTASMPAPGLTPTPTGASQRGGHHSFADDSGAATTATSGAATPASAIPPPPGGLKRGASNISLTATNTATAPVAPAPAAAATATPAPATVTPAPAPAAPATATTTTNSNATPAVAPPVKAKPKTAKEIAAEKKAALAAAKAAQAAEAAAAAAAQAQAANTADVESKGTPATAVTTAPPALAPTPKLTARQQMLQNKAEKAAARAERAAERAAEKSAALAEKQAAAAAAQAAAAASAAATPASGQSTSGAETAPARATGSGALGGEVVQPTAGSTPMKVSAIIKRPDSKAKLAAATAATAPTIAAPAPASAATPAVDSVADSQESAGVPPLLVLPEATQPTPLLFWSDAPRAYNRFNGLSANAVFPVPSSSLHCSIWSNILKGTNDDLSVNPYGLLTTPISELLDLTLPPGDALLSAGPVWPRPMSYYTNGMTADGICWTPAGKHIHQRSAADMAQLPSLPPLPPPSLQPKADAVFQPGTRSAAAPASAPIGGALPTPSVVQPPKAAKAQREEGSVERATREYRERAAASAAAAANGNAAATAAPASTLSGAPPAQSNGSTQGASMSALRQLFPGVKMSTASAGKK